MEVERASSEWWQGRPVLVTGCHGLLGSWLCRALTERGARVRGLARGLPPAGGAFERFELAGRVEPVRGDVTDAALLGRAMAGLGGGRVFHLAAQSQVSAARLDPAATFETNVRGTWQVLEVARRNAPAAAVVLASTAAVYGDRGNEPHVEHEALPPVASAYAASKICAERIGASYHRTVGLPVVAARTTNLYGGGDTNAGRIVAGAIGALLSGEAPVIRSDGKARRDYLYVEDAVRGYLALAEAAEQPGVVGETFNLAGGQVSSVLEVVAAILRVGGRPDLRPRVLAETSDEIPVTRVSAAKARRVLSWTAEVPLDMGLRRTIAWQAAAAAARPALQAQ